MSRSPNELFDCERVNAYLESYLLDQVPPPERRGMRLHIHRCPVCFEKVTSRDPLALFAPLADEERPEAFWDGFWEEVSDGIRGQEESRRRAVRIVRPAAAAALLLIAGAAALILGPRLLTEKTPSPASRLVQGTPAGPEETRELQRVTADPVAEAGGPLPQTVELVRTEDSRDVQVYSMQYRHRSGEGRPSHGSPQGLTELVLIVDAGLEL